MSGPVCFKNENNNRPLKVAKTRQWAMSFCAQQFASVTLRARPEYHYNKWPRANVFLLFAGKERANMAAPRGEYRTPKKVILNTDARTEQPREA